MIDQKLIVSTDSLEGYKIVKYLGMVWGMTDEGWQKLRNKKMFPDATMNNMKIQAEGLNANAIVGVKLTTADAAGYSDVICFGTRWL
jgi:uncharacterized protein YbjQ (UPF0145 family)